MVLVVEIDDLYNHQKSLFLLPHRKEAPHLCIGPSNPNPTKLAVCMPQIYNLSKKDVYNSSQIANKQHKIHLFSSAGISPVIKVLMTVRGD